MGVAEADRWRRGHSNRVSKEEEKFVKGRGIQHGQRPQGMKRLVFSEAGAGKAKRWRGGEMGPELRWIGSVTTNCERFQKLCSSIRILSCRQLGALEDFSAEA